MIILKKIILPFLIISIITSCNNDDISSPLGNNENPTPTNFSDYFGNNITRTFLGLVVDKNNNPIENVSISIGNDNTQTDSNGVFIISGATVYERFAYIKAEKEGYINASRAAIPSSGTNKVTIMMLDENIVGSTSSGSIESISLANGATVTLNGEYIKEDGSSYSGNVDVIMHHLDPTDENMINQMPGMLYAANVNNEERMLQTLGMLAVELKGSGGEYLNIAEGSSAEIRVPVDAILLASAPSTIPLWYFEEDNGYWIEEGQATLIGNEYVGIVTHFSFWNCDIPAEAINLCITVTDNQDSPLSNLTISITSLEYGTTYGFTNENGEVCGLVPSNQTLELNTFSWDVCGENSLYNATIGPFTMDDTISITVSNSVDTISETIIGNFNNCNDNPVTEGYIGLSYGNQIFVDVVEDGAFEINLIRCLDNDTFTIQGADYTNLQVTDSINYTFTTPLTNIGTITACNDVTEFIQYSIDGGADNLLITEFINVEYGIINSSNMDSLMISGQGGNNCFYMQGSLTPIPHEGAYDFLDWNDPNDTGFNIIECINMSETNNNVIYNLTSFGEIGGYIDINFSGDYEDYEGVPHTIVGVIHVIRDN